MGTSTLPLRTPTHRTKDGPRLCFAGRDLTVEYDFETDSGSVEWSRVVFRDVIAFEYRDVSCCVAEQVQGSREVVRLWHSDRLSPIVALWEARVGWQDQQQKLGGGARFELFRMYFDDAACIDAVAASCEVP